MFKQGHPDNFTNHDNNTATQWVMFVCNLILRVFTSPQQVLLAGSGGELPEYQVRLFAGLKMKKMTQVIHLCPDGPPVFVRQFEKHEQSLVDLCQDHFHQQDCLIM